MSFSCRNIETHDMPERPSPISSPPALPYIYPLDDFYAAAGMPLPKFERIGGEEVPEPYRSLLVHQNDMTPTLEKFHGANIHLRILSRGQRGDFYFRQVALHLDASEKPVEFGANKVSLLLFPPKARQLILEEHLPLGRILKECDIGHRTQAKAFFKVEPDGFIRGILGVDGPATLYGRRATIFDNQNRPLSEIVEILPPTEQKKTTSKE
jgi:chorismate-pyruvate lyase